MESVRRWLIDFEQANCYHFTLLKLTSCLLMLQGASTGVMRMWMGMREMTSWNRKLVTRMMLVRRRIYVTRSTVYTCELQLCSLKLLPYGGIHVYCVTSRREWALLLFQDVCLSVCMYVCRSFLDLQPTTINRSQPNLVCRYIPVLAGV